MKVVLRADASSEIGAGHVMRQIALAEELSLHGVETFLVGEIQGLSWLDDKIKAVPGLRLVSQPIGTFDSRVLGELGASVASIDSYALSQEDLSNWESQSNKTFVFIDGPWQNLSGSSAVVPLLRDDFSWLSELDRRFRRAYIGPDYIMMRSEIKGVKLSRLRDSPLTPQILVVLGGSDPRGLTSVIGPALVEIAQEHRVVVIGSGTITSVGDNAVLGQRGTVRSSRSSFLEELRKTTLVISGAGTTSGEILFLGIPSIFIPVADNQVENARALESFEPSSVIWPDSRDFKHKLVSRVAELSMRAPREFSFVAKNQGIDGLGAQRVAKILLGEG